MFETLTKGFKAAKNRLAGVTELTEENIDQALRDVRLSLLEADVEFSVTKEFLRRVKEKAIGQTMQSTAVVGGRKIKIGPVEQFVKICQDELESMMSWEGEPIVFSDKKGTPTGIMMVGLQGSGKTTSSAKLARLLEHEYGKKVLLVAADVARPGAIEQLQVLGEQIDVPVFAMPDANPVEICERAVKHCKSIKRDTIVYDTAGRLAIDEQLMDEVHEIRRRTKPQNVFLVVDAMIGQDSVKTAKAFHDRLDLSGVVLTKLDGDARGGAALSVKQVTGAPVKFVGMGETLDRMEVFRPDGMASRILGMGDVVGLMKDFESVVDEEKAEADAQRMLQGDFTLDDFLEQIEMLQNMGPLQDIFEKLPFFQDSMPEGFQVDENELVRTKAIVSSMTKAERRDVTLFKNQPGRIERVAKGSGREKKEVGELLQRFVFMRQMMGDIGNQAGMLSKIPGMKQMAQARRMRDVVKTGGLEQNPMMAELADQLLEAAIAEGGAPGGLLPGGARGAAGGGGSSTRKKVDKNKKKRKRKMKRKSRRKGRK
ncbi:MAG TPA: signal recognition particle protein [Polyangiaceae bacterium LLY-WYZ-15_(1-7)]|nr:signal recognition particle protein [Sandaracinus sp.]HJK92308.1 signal recognition particle protein [Polyangiaceae bacterium LLY-WYZ-15_(1-7)]HJK99971.1 signal recognition particle protein [Polyangiaceae bacterium LLY-WYZ-15_(1-7)]HJL10343.1 signal recognition particle protein [Polyangiaceae bacterium LLY-WYZ-15_(1-7)]HJL26259.1 signal recognition particle protein [Polyangiaceae bacterium LLY-WYZ-15_(1-7)]